MHENQGAATMDGTEIATVVEVIGNASARGPSGELRDIAAGDPLREGETVVLGERGGATCISSAPGRVRVVASRRRQIALEGVVDAQDISELQTLIEKHLRLTGSDVARHILESWETQLGAFVKVMPTDYKRVLEAQRSAVSAG